MGEIVLNWLEMALFGITAMLYLIDILYYMIIDIDWGSCFANTIANCINQIVVRW